MEAEQSPVKGMAAAAEFDGGELWTDEKHVSFLNWMEACFVRRLAEDVGRGRCRLGRRRPRLDRFVPDISESTHDLRIRGVKYGGKLIRIRTRCMELIGFWAQILFDFGLGSMGAGKAARGIRRSGKAGRRPSTAVGDGDSGDQVGLSNFIFIYFIFRSLY